MPLLLLPKVVTRATDAPEEEESSHLHDGFVVHVLRTYPTHTFSGADTAGPHPHPSIHPSSTEEEEEEEKQRIMSLRCRITTRESCYLAEAEKKKKKATTVIARGGSSRPKDEERRLKQLRSIKAAASTLLMLCCSPGFPPIHLPLTCCCRAAAKSRPGLHHYSKRQKEQPLPHFRSSISVWPYCCFRTEFTPSSSGDDKSSPRCLTFWQ